MTRRRVDRIGERHGRLTVLARSEKSGRSAWVCQCDCGGTVCVTNSNIATGNTVSCGCVWKEKILGEMVGEVFGLLKVIGKAPSSRIGRSVFAKYRCVCSCGSEVDVLGVSLRSGATRSCGFGHGNASLADSERQRAVYQRRAAIMRSSPGVPLSVMRRLRREARDAEAATGLKHDIDHVVPLISDIVCGLHVEANLSVIPASVNRGKRNRYWPNMPEV